MNMYRWFSLGMPLIRHSREGGNPGIRAWTPPRQRHSGQLDSVQLPSAAFAGVASAKGQATTEVVLLLPLFMFFLYAFAKIFAVLILVQKMEIASFYAARRWQLESHRNIAFEGFDNGALKGDILKYVNNYLGFGNPQTQSFLGLTGPAQLSIQRTQVWQVVTLTVLTRPINTPLFKFRDMKYEVTKYVPNRDRPIAFVLPGLKQ